MDDAYGENYAPDAAHITDDFPDFGLVPGDLDRILDEYNSGQSLQSPVVNQTAHGRSTSDQDAITQLQNPPCPALRPSTFVAEDWTRVSESIGGLFQPSSASKALATPLSTHGVHPYSQSPQPHHASVERQVRPNSAPILSCDPAKLRLNQLDMTSAAIGTGMSPSQLSMPRLSASAGQTSQLRARGQTSQYTAGRHRSQGFAAEDTLNLQQDTQFGLQPSSDQVSIWQRQQVKDTAGSEVFPNNSYYESLHSFSYPQTGLGDSSQSHFAAVSSDSFGQSMPNELQQLIGTSNFSQQWPVQIPHADQKLGQEQTQGTTMRRRRACSPLRERPSKRKASIGCIDCPNNCKLGETRCTRCHNKWMTLNADPPVFSLDPTVPDFAAAIQLVYPPVEANGPMDDDAVLYMPNEEYHLRRIINAINTVCPDGGSDEWAVKHQRQFNGYAAKSCRAENGLYANNTVTARVRFLWQAAISLHIGADRSVYAAVGDNKGYRREDGLKFSQRIDRICKILAQNKIIAKDVIEGRGVLAFAGDPDGYHSRKMSNKATNQVKKARLEGQRRRDSAPTAERGADNARRAIASDRSAFMSPEQPTQSFGQDPANEDFLPRPLTRSGRRSALQTEQPGAYAVARRLDSVPAGSSRKVRQEWDDYEPAEMNRLSGEALRAPRGAALPTLYSTEAEEDDNPGSDSAGSD